MNDALWICYIEQGIFYRIEFEKIFYTNFSFRILQKL